MAFIQQEYAAIAEGIRNGTLPAAGADHNPPLWIEERFSSSGLYTGCREALQPGFGEQFNASIKSSTAYSFGNCSRKDAAKVFVSKELQATPDLGPGPLGYKIPTNMGPDGAAKTVSSKAPLYGFGTDPTYSAELREFKACGVYEGTTVARDLKGLRDRVHNRTGIDTTRSG